MATSIDIQMRDRIGGLLLAYLDAITALLTTQVQEYTLNTGQGTQRVTRLDLQTLQDTYIQMYNQYDALNNRCNGHGVVQGVPKGAAPWLDRI